MNRAKILIVEDESIIAMDIKNILKMKGFDVIGISFTGEEAIKLVDQYNPDIILMDIIIKGDIDGITTAEKIKSKYEIPIIYLTAHSDEKTLNRAKATEPYGYILKPINENEMYSAIVTALYKHELEMKLKQSEVKFRALTENSPVAIFIIQGDMFRYMNPAAVSISGYPLEELQGKQFWHILHPDFKDALRDFGMARQRGEDIPTRYGFKIITKNGEEKWLDYTATIIEYENKPATLGTAFDITEQKRVLDELRISEEKFSAFFRSSPIPASINTFKDGKYIEVNERMLELSGYTEDELIGKTIFDLGIYANDDELSRYVNVLRKNDTVRNQEYEFRTKSGKIYTGIISSETFKIRGEKYIISSTMDISERKIAEKKIQNQYEEIQSQYEELEAMTEEMMETHNQLRTANYLLAEEKDRLSAVLRYIDEGVITINRDEKIDMMNRAAENITGWEESEAIGKPIADIISIIDEKSGKSHIDTVPGVLSTGEEVNLESNIILIARDGSRKSISLNVVPIKNLESSTIGAILLIRNINQQ